MSLHYVIMSTARSGSNWFGEMIGSHPQLRYCKEIFNKRSLNLQDHMFPWMRPWPTDPQERINHIDTQVATGGKWGFKALQAQMKQDCKYDGWWQCVPLDTKILVLRRCNYLESFVSLKQALKTDQWHSKIPIEQEPIKINVKGALTFCNDRDDEHRRLNELTWDCPRLDVTYEELTSYTRVTMCRVEAFLGMPPNAKRNGVTVKTGKPLKESVENYDELCEGFKGTKWMAFLRV